MHRGRCTPGRDVEDEALPVAYDVEEHPTARGYELLLNLLEGNRAASARACGPPEAAGVLDFLVDRLEIRGGRRQLACQLQDFLSDSCSGGAVGLQATQSLAAFRESRLNLGLAGFEALAFHGLDPAPQVHAGGRELVQEGPAPGPLGVFERLGHVARLHLPFDHPLELADETGKRASARVLASARLGP